LRPSEKELTSSKGDTMEVKLVHVTPDAEKHIAYCARVSSPNQDNPEYAKLIRYCVKNNHYSILEMASMCLEITTTRAISPQILRHRSFSFQEFSQRYAEAASYESYTARRQDLKNKQNSIDDMLEDDLQWFVDAQKQVWDSSYGLYEEALARGVAKEQARALLPLNTVTKLYMNGTIRSWVHYIQVRTDPSTQKEHRDIAMAAKKIFIEQFPTIAEAMEWTI
jgi:thymidylate synthase (FAD)